MTNPAWTPSPHDPESAQPDPAPADDPSPASREAAAESTEAERVRQGRIVLRTRTERIVFAASLAVPVIVLVVLWLAHVL